MICEIRGIPIHTKIFGEGAPIVMIHGYYPDHRLMTGCMEPIFEQLPGWQRIYLDLPGMGQTPGPAWLENSDQMLEVVLEWIDRMVDGRPFLIAGESYGGYITRGVVHRRPEQVLGAAMICPMIEPDLAKRDLPQFKPVYLNPDLMKSLGEQDRTEFGEMAIVQTAAAWQAFRDDIMPGVRAADSTWLEHLRATGYGFSFDVDEPSFVFERPSLIILGRQDTAVGYRDAWKIMANYPRMTFAVLGAAGHNAQSEQAELFNQLIRNWLERVQMQLEMDKLSAGTR
jgi:pimeloyl-ACP methyl ester carboxylesterase